jgi:hypothetical protein
MPKDLTNGTSNARACPGYDGHWRFRNVRSPDDIVRGVLLCW